MGVGKSKFVSSGALKGAYAPPLPNVVLPPKMDPEVRTYSATVPHNKKGGDKMQLVLNDDTTLSITIPSQIKTGDGQGMRTTRPGDKFKFKFGNFERVIASTLHSLPGTTVVEAKPMIFSNCSETCTRVTQSGMSKSVNRLLQEAQSCLLQLAVEKGCNAILGVNCNVSTDSSGDTGSIKTVIVTMTGTPCVIMGLDKLPTVEVDVFAEAYEVERIE